MERYIWDLIVLSVRTLIWIFMATINTGPWLMENFYLYILLPMLGRERFLRMGKGKGSTIPLCMALLGLIWGGVWLLFWGAFGVPELAGWGVFFGVVAGWRAGVFVADEIEQARAEILLEERDQPTTDSVPQQRMDNRAGEIDSRGFDQSLPPEDKPQPSGRKLGATVTQILLAAAHIALAAAVVRNMGIYIVASKGSGKSRALGRILVKGDVLAGIPGLVIDPAGGTIDNLLDSLLRLPPARQKEVWPRIVYIDAGNQDAVVPFPLYYKLSEDEHAFTTASRYLEVVRMLDPNLTGAAIKGWNALKKVGQHAGIALAAMGGQITEAEHLLDHPKAYRERIRMLAAEGKIERDTAIWLLDELTALKPDIRSRRLASFRDKAGHFSLYPPMKAMFGADKPGIDWNEVVAKKQTVLLDLRHLTNLADQQFLLLWVLHSFVQFVKTRGIGRHKPIALTIDEISILTMMDGQSPEQPFAALLDNLLNMWARQSQIWVTLSHQEAWQVSERMFDTLMGCGTRIVGRTSSNLSAISLANSFFPPDPHMVKRHEPTFDGEGRIRYARPVNYGLDEQISESAIALTRLGKFHFFRKTVDGEGGGDLPVERLNMEGYDAGAYPDDVLLAQKIRPALHARTARPVAEILSEIAERQRRLRQIPPGSNPNDTRSMEEALSDPASESEFGAGIDRLQNAIVGSDRYDEQGYVVE